MIPTVAFLALGCAQQGMPSGGPKDVTPPRMLHATPPSGVTRFTGDEFYIEFDEYVQVKDAENRIIVSPPMKKRPEYATKGHGVRVRIKDTLQPNTTYLFQFQEAIVDFNEGNPLPVLEYVLSTGDVVDSFSLSGRVEDAYTGGVWKEPVTVALYNRVSLADSTVAKEIPTYITRCDRQGLFHFHNVRDGAYYIVAFEDGDKDMRLGAEAAAWCDTMVFAEYVPPSDTAVDTILAVSAKPGIVLRISSNAKEKQRVKSANGMQRKGYAEVVTMLPMKKPVVKGLSSNIKWVANATMDTLKVWTLPPLDTLWVALFDSTGIDDTLKLRYNSNMASALNNKRGKDGNTASQVRFSATSQLAYFDSLRILFPNPMEPKLALDSIVEVTDLSDSSLHLARAVLSDKGLKALVEYKFVEGKKYACFLPPHVFTDIFGVENDSVTCKFEVTDESQYGHLNLAVSTGDIVTPFLIQLLDKKDDVVQQCVVKNVGLLAFPHLLPGSYRVRAIEDRNGNGQWDGGDYWSQRQPERTYLFEKRLEVRANWEFNEEYSIQ
ncbi:MAG: Ig-like domain-containing protein [Bacteroidales bacterium]|nr:Ig-like domain-containing protein [Bacteroidales bacterium]